MRPAALTGSLLARRGSGAPSAPPGRGEAVRVSVPIDRARHLRLKLAALHAGTSMRAILEEALRRHLDRSAPAASAAGGEAEAPAAAQPGRRSGSA